MTQGRIQREGEETNGGVRGSDNKKHDGVKYGGRDRTAVMGRGGRRLGKRGRFSDGT